MKTTRGFIKPVDYLGIDLSDRYANNIRPNDVCGLTSIECNKLSAAFWLWEWPDPEHRLNVSEIAKEIGAAKSTMIDGPQALAAIGNSMRGCERTCGAAGKTPDILPLLGKPFAGFVRSSVELFGAFAEAELLVSPSQFMGGISEVYPGDIWHRLVGRTIPKKSTRDGRRARKLILQALGITGLPALPTHDQNDACISALMAAAADSKVSGMGVRGIGSPLVRDSAGTLREGPIVIPLPSDELPQTLREALRELQTGAESRRRLPPVKGKHRRTSLAVSEPRWKKQSPYATISFNLQKKAMHRSARTPGHTTTYLTSRLRNGRKLMRRESCYWRPARHSRNSLP